MARLITVIDFVKKLMEQALELTIRFAKRDGEWFADLGDELEEYSQELKARLCDMDDDEPADMDSEEFEQWTDACESLEDLLSEAEERLDELT